jgi:Immunoglobulin domain.
MPIEIDTRIPTKEKNYILIIFIDMSVPTLHIYPEQTVVEGSTVTITCEVLSSERNLTYTWYFQSKVIQEALNIDLKIIRNVSIKDSGSYACQVESSYHKQVSLSMDLTVQCKSFNQFSNTPNS